MRGLAIAMGLAALLLAGCGGAAKPACPSGKLCLQAGNSAEPISLDPPKTQGTWEDNVLSDMFLGLVTDDASGNAIPGAAESWTTSPDGLTWTFRLRDEVWSDGVPLTADDFVFSLRRLQDPKTTSEYSYLVYVIKNAEAVNKGKAPPESLGVKALDPHTLQITLEHPAPYLPQLLKHQITYPVPKHVIDKWGDAWIQPEHAVSNGPFMLVSWKLGDRIRLVKNPRFYDAKNVCLDEVIYYPISDKISAERRVKRGELDMTNDIQSNRVRYLRQSDQMPAFVRTHSWLGVTYLAFNTRMAKFKDKRVREALSMAIDRDFIAYRLRGGGELPAYAMVPPGVSDYPGGVTTPWASWPIARRQAEARRLLAAAGYGPGHPLKVEITRRGIENEVVYPSVQADWKAIGVQATLIGYDSQIAYQAFRARTFEVADAAWIADFNDALTFLGLQQSATGAQNYGDYKNPAYDDLLARADQEADSAKRALLLKQAEQMMIADLPIAPVFVLVAKNLVSPDVTGWVDNIVDHHRKRWLCFRNAEARRRGAG